MKYRPDFPERFGSIQDARAFCRGFFDWYNAAHRHSGIAMMTPEQVHYGRAGIVLERRGKVLAGAYNAHPERFVRGMPAPAELPGAVWINPPQEPLSKEGGHQTFVGCVSVSLAGSATRRTLIAGGPGTGVTPAPSICSCGSAV